MSLGTSPKGSPGARDKRVPQGLDFDLDESAQHGTADLDSSLKHDGKEQHQEAMEENHDDKNESYDPNGMGPSMRVPYEASSPHFEESNGFDQVWNENQRLGSPEETGYPRRSMPA